MIQVGEAAAVAEIAAALLGGGLVLACVLPVAAVLLGAPAYELIRRMPTHWLHASNRKIRCETLWKLDLASYVRQDSDGQGAYSSHLCLKATTAAVIRFLYHTWRACAARMMGNVIAGWGGWMLWEGCALS